MTPHPKMRRRGPATDIEAHILKQNLAERLPSWAIEYLDPATAPDALPDAAEWLITAAPNELRGWCAVLLYLMDDVPLPAFRAALRSAWNHDHRHVQDAAGSKARLRAMFRRGGSPPPPGLPPIVRVWRGVHGVPFKVAIQGLSWTLDRDRACWFASRHSGGRAPMVVAADTEAADILHYDDERQEREIICSRLQRAFVDGTVDDWQQGAERAGTMQQKN